MGLRDYQQEALQNVRREFDAGVNKQLIVQPTGTGKTVTFAHLPETIGMQPGEQMMCFVQRNELVFQAHDKLQKYNPDLKVDIEKAQYRSDPNADIVVASIQSVGRTKFENDDWIYSDRLKKFDPDRFKILVFDEAHHLLAKQYQGPLRYFEVYKPEVMYDNPGKLLLGVTATPSRSDNNGLEKLIDKIVYGAEPGQDLLSFINRGYLSKILAHRVDTSVDLSEVGISKGDFVVNELEKTVNTPARNKLIVQKYQELGEGLPLIAFTVDVQHTMDLAEEFRKAGIAAYGVSGSTPEKERRNLIAAYNAGQIQGLISCAVLLEGFDCLDQETEILTGKGWKGIAELESIHSVYAFDKDSRMMALVPVEAKTVRARRPEEKMVYFNSQRINLRVTENHKIFARKPNGRGGYKEHYEILSSLEAATYSGALRIPLSAPLECFPGLPLSDDEIRLIAWFMTDGGYEGSSYFVISQSKDYWREIESLLKRLGLSYKHSIKKSYGKFAKGVPSRDVKCKPVHVFRVPLGWRRDQNGWKKYFPYLDKNVSPLLHLMTTEQFEVFWSEALKGDGSNFLKGKSGWLWCDRKQQADSYTQMAVLRGFATSFGTQVTRNRKTVYRVTVRKARELDLCPFGHNKSKRQHIPIEESWKEESVWCVTNRLGTLVTRRNGKVVIVGNSPRASVGLWARPTKSQLLYQQGVGRILRPFPAPEDRAGWAGWTKPYAILIDFVDSCVKHRLVTLPTLFGLKNEFNFKGGEVAKTMEEVEKIQSKAKQADLSLANDLEGLKAYAEKIDLFAKPVIPEEARKYSQLAWVSGLAEGTFQLTIPDAAMLTLRTDTLGTWHVAEHNNGVRRDLYSSADLQKAFAYADRQVPRDAMLVLSADAKWRYEEPTDKQIWRIGKLYPELRATCKNEEEFGKLIAARYSRGEASQLISQRMGGPRR